MATSCGQEFGKVTVILIIILSPLTCSLPQPLVIQKVYHFANKSWATFLICVPIADIVKMIDSQPDLASVIRRVRGGYLKIQGTWMPYEVCTPQSPLFFPAPRKLISSPVGGSQVIPQVGVVFSANFLILCWTHEFMSTELPGPSEKI